MYVQLNYSIYTTGQLMKNYFKFISEKKNPANYLIKYRLFKILHFITKQLQFIYITHHFYFGVTGSWKLRIPRHMFPFLQYFWQPSLIFNVSCNLSENNIISPNLSANVYQAQTFRYAFNVIANILYFCKFAKKLKYVSSVSVKI